MSDPEPAAESEEEAETPEGAAPPLATDPIPGVRTDVETVGPGGEAPVLPPKPEAEAEAES
jgi:hypothetical protein